MKPDTALRVQRAKLLETRKASLKIAPVALACISVRFVKQGKSCLRKTAFRQTTFPAAQRPSRPLLPGQAGPWLQAAWSAQSPSSA
jgi:hypothetical protein